MFKTIDLYIDLDGVILRRTGDTDFRGHTNFDVAPNAMELLAWAIETFNCYWLTRRSRNGSYIDIERAFRLALPATIIPEEVRHLIRAIFPSPWGIKKLDGIDVSRDFYWVDDNPDDASVDVLEKGELRGRLIIASTDRDPDDLERVKFLLKQEAKNLKNHLKAKQSTFEANPL